MSAVADALIKAVPASGANAHKWHTVNADDGAVAITGGWNGTQPFLGQCVQVDKWKYVELNKQAAWFIKGVAGGKNLRGDLKQVKLLELIREKMKLLHE